eukprot:CAMPEP_0117421764 /NCGR_PEP_ID=MMETSP0758-20121206/2753_1 /TAXON_ID=63605 /ORGANISM="Percolomonas cosmopolitus, Strain AE-1 (ATCC 50343)" /LENGTH=336 /DNA_ID=CAMNT_0005204009 /DNA_START=78 /DNA_END=1088 /DNA_ORIENTATION=-
MTQISCPAAILKRQSVLEMYGVLSSPADYLLCDWTKLSDEERFLKVLRWALEIQMYFPQTGIQDVKPYNPIIGETFSCSWEHKDGSTSTYVSEQVCHHPPISGCYMENRQHGFSYERTVEPRTTFHGNSIGSTVEGENIFTVVPLDEEYIITPPDVNMRNLMWLSSYLEQNGEMTVECKKTNMTAKLIFEEKNNYGMSGSVFKNNKKIYSLKGNMNKVVQLRDSSTKKTSDFAFYKNNVRTLHPSMKVKKVDEQDENESRRVWHKLTKALYDNNLDIASVEKSIVEEKQRALRKERPNDWSWETHWKPKLFSSKGRKSVNGTPLFVYNQKLTKKDM